MRRFSGSPQHDRLVVPCLPTEVSRHGALGIRVHLTIAALDVDTDFRQRGFHEYYSGVKTAPVLTVFVGGNHEASNHLQVCSPIATASIPPAVSRAVSAGAVLWGLGGPRYILPRQFWCHPLQRDPHCGPVRYLVHVQPAQDSADFVHRDLQAPRLPQGLL